MYSYLYSYELAWYDIDDNSTKHYYGFINASSYKDCMEKLVQWYGEDEIEDVKITYLNDQSFVQIKDELDYIKLKKELRE